MVCFGSEFEQIGQETKSPLLSIWDCFHWNSSFHSDKTVDLRLTHFSLLPQQPHVVAGSGPWIIRDNFAKTSNFSAWWVEQLPVEPSIPGHDLVPHTCHVRHKKSLNQLGECGSRHIMSKFHTCVPTFEELLRACRPQVPEHASICIHAHNLDSFHLKMWMTKV